MTNTANFVKLNNGMIINVGSIDGIFTDNSRAYNGGYTIQLNGKDFHIDDKDIQPILNVIGMSTNTFDPNKRIDTTTRGYDFRTASAKIKTLVDEFNHDRIYAKLEMKVNPDSKVIKLTSETVHKTMVIQDGIVISDELQNSAYTELKTKINNILIEG